MTVNRGIHKESRRLIAEAIKLGWTEHVTGSGAITLNPPPGVQARSIRIPHTTKRGPSRSDWSVVHNSAPDRTAIQIAIEQALVAPEPDAPPPREASRKPWLARKSPKATGGTLYESHAVVEIRYVDGSVVYECAEPGCGWTNADPRRVAKHYGAAHTRHGGRSDKADQTPVAIDPDYTEPASHRGYSPTDRLVALVSEQIRLAIAADMDPDEISRQLLTWFHDRPDLPDPEPREPLGPEQILDRIRMLVDQGESLRIREQISELSQQLESAQHEAERLRAERIALRELLNEDT